MKNKSAALLFAILLMLLAGYWLKNQMGINLVESRSLSNIPPFKYLKRNNVLLSPDPGVLLEDSFDSREIFRNWSSLWMREKGAVTLGKDLNGINNSGCLVVKSRSEKSWVYSHYKFIEVRQGDVFSFNVNVKLSGQKIIAYAAVCAFDEDKKAITWSYVAEKADKTDTWVKITKRFKISDDIHYIKFKLSGVGMGEFRFDDVVFRKETGAASMNQKPSPG